MSALAPVPCSRASGSNKRRSPAPAAMCETKSEPSLKVLHCCRSSDTPRCGLTKVRTRFPKSFSLKASCALINLRSLMVMLSILSMSFQSVSAWPLNPRYKPDNAQKNYDAFHNDNKDNVPSFLNWARKSCSGTLTFLLFVGILCAVFAPGTLFGGSQGDIFVDSGESLLMRIGFLIPAIPLFVGSIWVGYNRYDMLKEATSYDDYDHKVQHSSQATNLLLVTSLLFLISFLVVYLSGASFDQGFWGLLVGFGGPMTRAVLLTLSLSCMIGFGNYHSANKRVKNYRQEYEKRQQTIRKAESQHIDDVRKVKLPVEAEGNAVRRRLPSLERLIIDESF